MKTPSNNFRENLTWNRPWDIFNYCYDIKRSKLSESLLFAMPYIHYPHLYILYIFNNLYEHFLSIFYDYFNYDLSPQKS